MPFTAARVLIQLIHGGTTLARAGGLRFQNVFTVHKKLAYKGKVPVHCHLQHAGKSSATLQKESGPTNHFP